MVVDAGEPVAYAGGDDDYVAGFELVGGGVADGLPSLPGPLSSLTARLSAGRGFDKARLQPRWLAIASVNSLALTMRVDCHEAGKWRRLPVTRKSAAVCSAHSRNLLSSGSWQTARRWVGVRSVERDRIKRSTDAASAGSSFSFGLARVARYSAMISVETNNCAGLVRARSRTARSSPLGFSRAETTTLVSRTSFSGSFPSSLVVRGALLAADFSNHGIYFLGREFVGAALDGTLADHAYNCGLGRG